MRSAIKFHLEGLRKEGSEILEPSTKDRAIVLDGQNCAWSKDCIGMPSVAQVGKRLAVLYDAPGGTSVSHMKRDIGLAWLNLPLIPPTGK